MYQGYKLLSNPLLVDESSMEYIPAVQDFRAAEHLFQSRRVLFPLPSSRSSSSWPLQVLGPTKHLQHLKHQCDIYKTCQQAIRRAGWLYEIKYWEIREESSQPQGLKPILHSVPTSLRQKLLNKPSFLTKQHSLFLI